MINWLLSHTMIDFSAIQCLWTIPVKEMGSCRYVGTKAISQPIKKKGLCKYVGTNATFESFFEEHAGNDSTILCTAMPQYSILRDSKIRFCDFSLVMLVSAENCVLDGVSWTVYHDTIQIRHVHWWANIP